MTKHIVISCSCVNVVCIFLCVCYDHGDYYFMYLYHRYADIPLHWTLLFNVVVSPLHRYFITPDTIISCTCIIVTRILYYTGHYYFIYLYHCYTDTLLHWHCYFMLLYHIYIDSPEFMT